MNVFCGNCGKRFSVEWLYKKVRNDTFQNDDAFCPKCGSLDIYLDNTEGTNKSIEVQIEYENALMDYASFE